MRIHGRGGQGAVFLANILAASAIDEGKYAQAFPSFGPERRGAPVVAFCRVDDRSIITREPVLEPDVVVVLDPTLLRAVDVTSGLKHGGALVVNTCTPPKELALKYGFDGFILATVDANQIAIQIIGQAITNTAMLGALLKAEPIISMRSVYDQINKNFPVAAEKNIKALQRAYEETRVVDLVESGRGGR